jgi:hypothetical protein
MTRATRRTKKVRLLTEIAAALAKSKLPTIRFGSMLMSAA